MVSGIGQVEQGHGAAAWRVEAPDAGQPFAVRLYPRHHLACLPHGSDMEETLTRDALTLAPEWRQ